MSKHDTLGTRDEQIFCLYCRNILQNPEEQKFEYHYSCNREIVQYKDELGDWYYLGLVQATIEDCIFDNNQRIIGLNLSYKGLTELPKLPFKYLQELNLSHNYLDKVPKWVYELPSLKRIFFPGNGFSKSLLLDILSLHHHGIDVISTGCAFDRKKNLENLNLSYLGAVIQEGLPETITNYFTRLKIVNLSWNGLLDFPDWVFPLTHLKELNLMGNKLISPSETKFQSKRIYKVNLADNDLEYIPDWIFELSHLEELSLLGNRIISLSEDLFQLSNLKRIHLSQNILSMDLMDVIVRLEQQGVSMIFH